MLDMLLHEGDDSTKSNDDVKTLNSSTESISEQGSVSDQAMKRLCKDVPGFKALVEWHKAQNSEDDGPCGSSTENSSEKDGSNGVTADSVKIVEHLMEGKDSGSTNAGSHNLSKRGKFVPHKNNASEHTSLEDEYVRKMLAPSKAMVEDMFMHGADFDGSGHIR